MPPPSAVDLVTGRALARGVGRLRPGGSTGGGSARFEFEIFGDVLVRRRLLGIAHRAGDMSPAFDQIADLLMDQTRMQFDSEGGHASGGWAALAPATVRLKARRNLDPRILRATGALMGSLTRRGDPNQELDVSGDRLVFRSRLARHRFHQQGTSRMPARPPLALREDAKRDAVRILQRYLVTGSA